VYSQSQDTTKIPVPIAKEIVKDLMDHDRLKQEVKNFEEHIDVLNQKLIVKDTIINIHKKKEITYLKQVETEKQKTENWRNQYEDVYTKYMVQKGFNKVYKYSNVVLAIVIGVVLIN
jgi:hypothetical protein